MQSPNSTSSPQCGTLIQRCFILGRSASRKCGGFSLVEITMAIGIVAFAFVSVLGLLPAGMNTFRKAMDASVTSQIFQRVVNEAQQTDFSVLTNPDNIEDQKKDDNVLLFDDQGNYLGKKGTINNTDKKKAIYNVKMRIEGSTSLPGSTTNSDLATVTVQIANNPGNIVIPSADSSDPVFYSLWKPSAGINIITQSTLVSRNTSVNEQ